ncbi:GTP-binding protein HflX [Natronobacillus azotifigens]|uniref:GTPase HflX n=1 Tax=Natronobacillus azotifigens TaxID=472978 RepID=A0A9J6RAG2_9BACI|nr:GTPase HflX [Natronobacillus azotifigens]MCZ0702640.1 GTPase HflX [Natronobacillus azotifigens]
MEENVLIIAVQKKLDDETRFHYSLEELKSLTETAKGIVVDSVIQKRDRAHPALYLGTGKLEEVEEIIEEKEIDLLIANDELSASQMRNLQEQFDLPIIDRSQLILDIFASRAKTSEGKLQVELAQYQYLLPRLHGQGHAMSRLGGGIGTRGPGETKLESDRRHINRRIDEVKRRLATVVNQREQYRNRRKTNHTFQIAIVGYTNAGKSTLFNRLTRSDAFEEDQLFATLDPMSRQMKLPSGLTVVITDTVGFMQDLPTALIAAFRSTLEEVAEADFIYHVVDASHPDQGQHQETVLSLLKELKADHIPSLTIYNKKDLIRADFLPINQPAITISAFDEADRKRLLNKTQESMKNNWKRYECVISASDGKKLQQYRQHSIIVSEEFTESSETYHLEGYLPEDHPLQPKH